MSIVSKIAYVKRKNSYSKNDKEHETDTKENIEYTLNDPKTPFLQSFTFISNHDLDQKTFSWLSNGNCCNKQEFINVLSIFYFILILLRGKETNDGARKSADH
ncbi:hypothetical protein SAMN05192559_11216 [Halobacillus karajensis]|uniref:Uncharacterized protein n=1 Tax=Halobacillus karajensis TaxID=195088 RepID=A0A024PA83_9BACI|nr:hypothetical protein [Halobacillus karajensis]CDQ21246.1 hypothetical protein BN982_03612 [Halobacillus karajensis]CDQ25322.1 hypothetical protein BN983_03640 [Halobacillus karajensis]CDQ25955.1 hypothetical protein BN981_00162 [Halobacillus karajensis]SEI10029.1 hypothetical protein SAMN05192559_11216 [Halobacillus karajensis]